MFTDMKIRCLGNVTWQCRHSYIFVETNHVSLSKLRCHL